MIKINKEQFFEEKNNPYWIFVEISTYKNRQDSIFMVYEWKDNIYYNDKVSKLNCKNYQILNFHSWSKKNVKLVYEIFNENIKNRKIDNNIKILFFIDKDFDDNSDINTKDIYITKWYSFENFYTNEKTFKDICINNFSINFSNNENQKYLDDFINMKNEFHTIVELINKALKYSITNWLQVSIKWVNFQQIINLWLDKIVNKVDIKNYIKENLNKWGALDFNEIDKIIFKDKSYDFYWKLELEFVKQYLYLINHKISKWNKCIWLKKENNDDFMDRFSKYAEFPNELKDYINNRLTFPCP